MREKGNGRYHVPEEEVDVDVRGEMEGEEAWKGEGRSRYSESKVVSNRRDWSLEEWKGIFGICEVFGEKL